jgi:host factor-I protein
VDTAGAPSAGSGVLYEERVVDTLEERLSRATQRCKIQIGNPTFNKKRTSPPDETFEEAAYLKALGEKQKVVSLKLADGEVVRGWIEYYDKNMVRVTRENGPNLFIFKHEIVYIAEDGKKK